MQYVLYMYTDTSTIVIEKSSVLISVLWNEVLYIPDYVNKYLIQYVIMQIAWLVNKLKLMSVILYACDGVVDLFRS